MHVIRLLFCPISYHTHTHIHTPPPVTEVGGFLGPPLPEAREQRDGGALWSQRWLRSRVQIPSSSGAWSAKGSRYELQMASQGRARSTPPLPPCSTPHSLGGQPPLPGWEALPKLPSKGPLRTLSRDTNPKDGLAPQKEILMAFQLSLYSPEAESGF